MRISENVIEAIKNKCEISTLISAHVNLAYKGQYLLGLCPFHNEKTPSFCVYPKTESFYCYGCGVGGDVINFIMLLERLEYVEAIENLAKKFGVLIDFCAKDDVEYRKKLTLYEINRSAAKFFHDSLINSESDDEIKKVQSYLNQRGINLQSIKKFGLGYAPSSGTKLTSYLLQKGYTKDEIISANLGKINRFGNFSGQFYSRLMFPIIDRKDRVIAFGGRSLDSNGIPKYLNTSDTSIYKKSSNLYALNLYQKNERLILCEGYLDVIALYSAGFTNTVATLGTSLTQDQAQIISKLTDEVIVAYDSDEAGVKATERAINLFKKFDIKVKVLKLKNAKDPDDFLKRHGENANSEFKKLLNSAECEINFEFNKLKQKFNLQKESDAIEYLTECTKVLSNCDNIIKREVYAAKLSRETGIDKSAIHTMVNQSLKKRMFKNKKSIFESEVKSVSFASSKNKFSKSNNLAEKKIRAQEILLSFVINAGEKANNIMLMTHENLFTDLQLRKIFEKVKSLSDSGSNLGITSICSNDFLKEETSRVAKILCSYDENLIDFQAAEESLKVLKEEYEKSQIKDFEKYDENKIKNYIESLKNKKI